MPLSDSTRREQEVSFRFEGTLTAEQLRFLQAAIEIMDCEATTQLTLGSEVPETAPVTSVTSLSITELTNKESPLVHLPEGWFMSRRNFMKFGRERPDHRDRQRAQTAYDTMANHVRSSHVHDGACICALRAVDLSAGTPTGLNTPSPNNYVYIEPASFLRAFDGEPNSDLALGRLATGVGSGEFTKHSRLASLGDSPAWPVVEAFALALRQTVVMP